MATENFFTWGEGGSKLTPEQIAIARQLLLRKKAQGADTSPVGHWTQGAARVADALGDVVQEKRLNSQEKDLTDYNSGLISSLLGGGASNSSPSPIPMTGAAVEVGSNSPAPAPDDVKALIAANVPPEMQGYATNLIGRESSFNPNAVSPTGATGLAQFTKGTGSQYGLVSDQGDLRKDPTANLKALVALTNDNRAGLSKALGRAPTDGELALAHQQGLQGAVNLLSGKAVPANNLAVNNIDPNSDPRDAASKIMAFYGGAGGQQVASLDPSSGVPMPGAAGQMRAADPAQVPVASAPLTAPPLPPPTTVAPAPTVASVPAVAPQQMAQSAPAMSPASGPALADAIKILSDPRANSNTRSIAEILVRQQQARQQAQYEQQLKMQDPGYQADLRLKGLQADQIANPRISPTDQANIDLNRDKFGFEKENSALTPDIKEYKFAKDNGYAGSFAQYQLDLKKSAANNTTINNGEGNKFYNTLDEANAKIFSGLSDSGIQGRSKLGQIDQLEGLLNSTGTGALAVLKQRAGDLGINTEGLSDIQAASAMLSKMIPEQRAPGSGPVSDADLAGFRNSLPRLINQPGGNATIINTMRGLTQYQIDMGTIADRVANREITPAEGRTMIANLPNPLSNFKAPPPGKENEGWSPVQTDVPGVTIRRKN